MEPGGVRQATCGREGDCLAGEAGLRIGETRALDWRRDVDLVAATIAINHPTRRGQTTTPKGGRGVRFP